MISGATAFFTTVFIVFAADGQSVVLGGSISASVSSSAARAGARRPTRYRLVGYSANHLVGFGRSHELAPQRVDQGDPALDVIYSMNSWLSFPLDAKTAMRPRARRLAAGPCPVPG